MMRYVRAISVAVAATALIWWIAYPAELSPTAFQHLAPPPPQPSAGLVEAVSAELPSSASLAIFPASADASQTPDAAKLRLQGTLLTPGRQAALISVGGAKPQWITVGAPAGGLEVVELHTGTALVRTSSGDTVSLEMFKRSPQLQGRAAAGGNGDAPS